MKFSALYEIESDTSVIHDDMPLRFGNQSSIVSAIIRNIVRSDYASPFCLLVQVFFDAPTIDEAQKEHTRHLGTFLNVLAAASGASLQVGKTIGIVRRDAATPMRDCLIWADAVRHVDPVPAFNSEFVASVTKLLAHEVTGPVRRAMRWYRLGCASWQADDQFQYFWFALEILAQLAKSTERVNDLCAICKNPLYCEVCGTYTTHKQYPIQAIRALIESCAPHLDDEQVESLADTRNALMHGSSLSEIKEKDGRPATDYVDVLGRIVFVALMKQYPPELFVVPLRLVTPTTYLRRSISAVAVAQAMIPMSAEDEVDARALGGIQASLQASRPPQSAFPLAVPITQEQVDSIQRFAFGSGECADICMRMRNHTQKDRAQLFTLIFATDLQRVKDVSKRNDGSEIQTLFQQMLEAPGAHWLAS